MALRSLINNLSVNPYNIIWGFFVALVVFFVWYMFRLQKHIKNQIGKSVGEQLTPQLQKLRDNLNGDIKVMLKIEEKGGIDIIEAEEV